MVKTRPAFLPGLFYHFYNRGHSRACIFREDQNYLIVMRKIKEYTKLFNLSMIAYCLMPSHYHFLVRQDGDSPAGYLPQRVFNSYSKAYNKGYDHLGTLFESPYQVKLIEKDSHLLHLCRYIHGNPQKDGLLQDLAEMALFELP